ncbi:ParB/RepB/Spo0J family partition protein [Kiritimatiellaeota bacterium B1221]|nr:ParB/RepB/Spo0J family partition protein [Kiritimatiellaeota bacterium B1221]
MATKKKGLGRGLDALMQKGTSTEQKAPAPRTPAAPAKKKAVPPKTSAPASAPTPQPSSEKAGPLEVAVHLITANPYQPRERFEEEALEELTQSISEMGILSPLLVRQRKEDGSGYQLIAGERRFRAAQRAGLKKVPVILRELTDLEALEIALVENLQRKDLNIIEEAEGYQRLADEFALTQEAIAKRVGKGRATVANALRLLALGPVVKTMISDGRLSTGHAKVLLSLELQEEQELLAKQAVKENWSVREIERQVKSRLNPPKPKANQNSREDIPADHVQLLTDKLHQKFGTSVRLTPSKSLANGKKQRGKIEIDIYSNDDLDRLLDLLGLSDTF